MPRGIEKMNRRVSTSRRTWMAAAILSALISADAAASGTTTPTVKSEGNTVRVDGEITEELATSFLSALSANPSAKTVVLNSPGGKVFPALSMARALKAAGVSTSVESAGICFSACSLVFLAGKERVATGKLGVHQISGTDDPSLTQAAIGKIYEDLVTYDTPSYLVSRMLRTPPDDMYVFSPEELERNSINLRGASKAQTIAHLQVVDAWVRKEWLVGTFVNTTTGMPFVALESNKMEPLLRIAHYPHRAHTFMEIMVPEGSISGTKSRLELRFEHGNDEPFSLFVDADIEVNAYAFDFPADPLASQKFWAAFSAATKLRVLNAYGVEIGSYGLSGSRQALQDFFKIAVR